MNSILSIIRPIVLCVGTHDTYRTGKGCVMNVASYLAGDKEITDKPASVDATIRMLAQTDNDFSSQGARQGLLPYVLRMIGSATTDDRILHQRNRQLTTLKHECEVIFARVWETVGGNAAPEYFGEYLREKLSGQFENYFLSSDLRQQGIVNEIARGIQWLDAVKNEVYSNPGCDLSAVGHAAIARDQVLTKLRAAMISMLPAQPIEETEVVQSRAKDLINCIKVAEDNKVLSQFLAPKKPAGMTSAFTYAY